MSPEPQPGRLDRDSQVEHFTNCDAANQLLHYECSKPWSFGLTAAEGTNELSHSCRTLAATDTKGGSPPSKK